MAAPSHHQCGTVTAMRTAIADDPDRLWNYREFAEWAGVSERTARVWAAEKGLPVLKLGRFRRIRVRDALAWADAQRVEPKESP
jgi:hypothetical protein